jgi:WhiB family redox-sensing transcriptional regulator
MGDPLSDEEMELVLAAERGRHRNRLLACIMRGIDLPSLVSLIGRPEWHQRAACKGQTDVFFPARGENTEPAKQLCRTCPVQSECRAYAVDNRTVATGSELAGIWGGTSARERRRLRQSGSDAFVSI